MSVYSRKFSFLVIFEHLHINTNVLITQGYNELFYEAKWDKWYRKNNGSIILPSDYLKRDIFKKTDKCSKVKLYDFLKEISPEYSLEGLMLKLKLQYFATWCEELTHWKRPWCWERLKAGEGDNRGWDGSMTSPTQWTWVWVNSELVMDREAWHAAVRGVAKSRTGLTDWTELNSFMKGLLKQYLLLHLMILKYAMGKDVGVFLVLFSCLAEGSLTEVKRGLHNGNPLDKVA